jgi:chromosome partitioning protein
MAAHGAHVIVFANEKGGTGKSTTAVHVAVALAAQGRSVAALDLDFRQKTLARYLENRAATCKRRDVDLPMPRFAVVDGSSEEAFDDKLAEAAAGAEFVVIDTPGRDDPRPAPIRSSRR